MGDTIGDKLSEQGLLNAVNAAIAELQTACTKLDNVKQSLMDHESSEEAHPDIRDLITDVVDATGFILVNDATTMMTQMVSTHDGISTAHPSLLTAIADVNTKVTELKSRLDVLDPQDPTDPETALALRLKAIEDEFTPILQGLQSAWLAAKMENKNDLAAAIALDYQSAAALKAAAIAQVMEEFEYVS